jgi:CRP/FNR family transcriptional regulator
VVIEETEFVAIPLNEADKWMGNYPVWRNFILSMYDSKLYQMIDTIDRLAFSKLDEQLLDYLENRTLGLEDRTLEITHQQIAHDLNASREAISRLLKKMEDQKLVKLGRNMITMLTY